MAGDPCYDNPDVDGQSEECSDTDTCKDDCDGCYKALLGRKFFKNKTRYLYFTSLSN